MVLETSHCPPFSSLVHFLKSIFFSCPLFWSLEVLWDHCFTLLLHLKRGNTFIQSFCFCHLSIFFLQFFGAYSDMRYALLLQLCCKNNVTSMNYFLIHELCSFPLLHDAILHEGWLSICYCSFLFLHELFPMFSLDWCVLIVILELFQFCVCFKLA